MTLSLIVLSLMRQFRRSVQCHVILLVAMRPTQMAEDQNISYIETSAKTNHNIDKVQYLTIKPAYGLNKH